MRFHTLLFFAFLLTSPILANALYLIKIQNPSSTPLVNFQLRVYLPQELIGKNITILSTNGSLIPFCYENIAYECSSTPLLSDGFIWIKVPYVNANETVYLYLLTSNKSYATNPTNIFDYYNDFSSPSELNNWTINNFTILRGDECYVSIDGLLASLNHAGLSEAIAKTFLNLSSDFKYVLEIKASISSAKFIGWLFIVSNSYSVDLTGIQPWWVYTLGPLESPINITIKYFKAQSDVAGCDRAYIDFVRVRKYITQPPSVTVIPVPSNVTITTIVYPITTTTSTSTYITSSYNFTIPAISLLAVFVSSLISPRRSKRTRKA